MRQQYSHGNCPCFCHSTRLVRQFKGGDEPVEFPPRRRGKSVYSGDLSGVKTSTLRRNDERGMHIRTMMQVMDMIGETGFVVKNREIADFPHAGVIEFSDLIMR